MSSVKGCNGNCIACALRDPAKEGAEKCLPLSELKVGQSAVIREVGGEGSLRQHFLDMGVIPEAEITLIKYAPMGDPAEYMIHGYELTLRIKDAEKILVGEPYYADEAAREFYHAHTHHDPNTKELLVELEHPGFGEGGK